MRFASVALLCAAFAAPSLFSQVPRPSPEFSVQMPGGKPLPLRTLKGKVVLLAFISTTCPHCQALTQELSAIQRDYAPRGVQVIESAFNDGVTEKAVQEFVLQYHPGFPVGMNDRTSVMAYLQYSILSQKPLYVPHIVFLDKQGVIRGDYAGESPFMQNAAMNIRAEFDKLLAAAGPAGGAARKSKR
jgi:thiol-disulfide isomerase/thioredoxin